MHKKNLLDEGWRKFIHLIQEGKHIEELFSLLITREEHADLAKRVLIIEALIKAEKTQREIAKNLKVSIAKITRGSNELKGISEKFKHFLDDIFL